jgi:hypothetical protein
MATETELWDPIASRRKGVLGTIKRSGLPQLTSVLCLPEPGHEQRMFMPSRTGVALRQGGLSCQ